MMQARLFARRLALTVLALASAAGAPGTVWGQIPGLPGVSAPAAPDTKGAARPKTAAAPTPDNPQATVATGSGAINVEKRVADRAVRTMLSELLPKYPGVRDVQVEVKDGVVTLDGQVEDDDVRDDVTGFTRRVEGVRLVLNRMKTDAQVLTAPELAQKMLLSILNTVSRQWLLVLLALAIIVSFFGLARLFSTYAETLLAPFVKNVMLRSVVGSLFSSILIIGGTMLGLSVLHLTHAVLSILGLAGVVGLAVGFAFRDIAENFIASLLLGVRRPFRIGDYIQVAGQAGVVSSLNTRATVLVTLEGNHVRIPNNVIYKEILINSSASATSRGTFDVVVPYEVSTATALEAMTRALRDQEEILESPPARGLVEALEPQGVRLRAYFWMPVTGVDGFKLMSDVKLRVKVALQQAGIAPPPSGLAVSVIGRVPVDVLQATASTARDSARDGAAAAASALNGVVTPAQAAANLKHDSRVAENVTATPTDGRPTPLEHAMSQAETHVSEEGTNLLKDGAGTA